MILALLDSQERYGLELVQLSDGQLKRGTVYVTLQRMEAKGLIQSSLKTRPPTESGIARRLYRRAAYGDQVWAAYQAAEAVMRDAPEPRAQIR